MVKKVLILGGGYAGVETALSLSKNKKKEQIEITVIDKNDYHTLLTELHEVAANRISEDGIIVPFSRIFKYTSVKYITDEIHNYDFSNKKICSKTKEYEYDYLVLATGSTPNYYGIEGLKEHSFPLWSYDDAINIREHIKDCFKKARCEDNEETKKSLLTFVVAGAGFTGVEMIGELAVWVKKLCKDYNIARSEVRLIVVDLMPRILSVLEEKNSQKAYDYMVNKLGIEIMLEKSVSEVSEMGFNASDTYIPCKTLIWAAGVRAVEDVENIDIEKLSARRLKTDQFGETKHKNVFAIGDVSALSPKDSKPYPAMVENAVQSGHGVAINILKDIKGEQKQEIKVEMHGTMVCVGNYFAVSEIMGKSLPSWLSILMKFLVNVHYIFEIAGFFGVSKYLYHEILERKQNKNIIEQHYSTRIQAWWLTPLRVFLGAIWLREGLIKVAQGWFETPKLAQFFGGADSFYENALSSPISSIINSSKDFLVSAATEVVETAAVATDAVSSATGAGEAATGLVQSATKVLLNWDFGFLKFIAVEGGEIAFKIHFSPMNWMVNNIILGSDTSQLIFQYFVVISEILIGLCLIAGAFTFIASGFSLILEISFLLTTGLYLNQWWMLFAGFAILGGAGRAFGVDYYLIPYISNYFEKVQKSKKYGLVFKGALDRHK